MNDELNTRCLHFIHFDGLKASIHHSSRIVSATRSLSLAVLFVKTSGACGTCLQSRSLGRVRARRVRVAFSIGRREDDADNVVAVGRARVRPSMRRYARAARVTCRCLRRSTLASGAAKRSEARVLTSTKQTTGPSYATRSISARTTAPRRLRPTPILEVRRTRVCNPARAGARRRASRLAARVRGAARARRRRRRPRAKDVCAPRRRAYVSSRADASRRRLSPSEPSAQDVF
jgi:hypothetical protein